MSWILMIALVASPFDDGNGAKPSLDQDSFPLPAGAIARLGGTPFWRREEAVFLFYWSAGKQLVCAEQDHIVVWDAETGRRIRTLRGHVDDVELLAGSPDGKLLASSGKDQTIRIWDGVDGRRLHEFRKNKEILQLCFSADSRLLAVVEEDATVTLRRMPEGNVQSSFRSELGSIETIAFSPNGERIATGSVMEGGATKIQIWDFDNGRPRLSSREFEAGIIGLEFSPDGSTLLAENAEENAHSTQLWSVASGKELLRVPHSQAATFAPDGRSIACVSDDADKIRILDARTGRLIREIGSEVSVYYVVYSPDSKRFATMDAGDAIRLFDVETGEEIAVKSTGHQAPATALGYSPDGSKLASTDENSLAIVWNLDSRSQDRRLVDLEKSVPVSVAFSPNGTSLAIGSNTGSVHVLDMRTGENQASFMTPEQGSVDALVFTRGESLLTASIMVDNASALFSDLKVGAVKRLAVGSQVESLAFGRNGRFLATGADDGSARLWDAATGRELRRFELGDKAAVGAVALRPDGWALAAAQPGWPTRAWDVKTKRELPRHYPSSDVDAMTFSPDGQYLATGCEDGAISIWNPATGLERASFRHGSKVNALAFAPDSQSIASGGEDGMILIWRLPKP